MKRFISACIDVKDLNDGHTVQIFIAGLSNEHVRYALIYRNESIMHELVAYAYKFVEADEMRDHHSIRTHHTKPRQLEPRKQESSRPSRP